MSTTGHRCSHGRLPSMNKGWVPGGAQHRHAAARETQLARALGPPAVGEADPSDHRSACRKQAISRTSLLSQAFPAEGRLQLKKAAPLLPPTHRPTITLPSPAPPPSEQARKTDML